jgi:hypothetical protein
MEIYDGIQSCKNFWFILYGYCIGHKEPRAASLPKRAEEVKE